MYDVMMYFKDSKILTLRFLQTSFFTKRSSKGRGGGGTLELYQLQAMFGPNSDLNSAEKLKKTIYKTIEKM